MNEKRISEMTNEEILRQQLELLAETSRNATDLELPSLTNSMSIIYSQLKNC